MIPRSRSPRSALQPPAARPSRTARSAPRPRDRRQPPGTATRRPAAPRSTGRVARPRTPRHQAGPHRTPPRMPAARVRARARGSHAQAATARRAAPPAGTLRGPPLEPARTLRPGSRTGGTPAPPVRGPGSAPRLNPLRGFQAQRPPALGAGREACQRAAVDGRARLGPGRLGPPRRSLPRGRRRAARRSGRHGLGAVVMPAAWMRARPASRGGRRRPGRAAAHDRLGAGPAQAEEPEPVPRAGRPAAGAAAVGRQWYRRRAPRTSRPMYSWNPSDTTEAFPDSAPAGRLAPRLAGRPGQARPERPAG